MGNEAMSYSIIIVIWFWLGWIILNYVIAKEKGRPGAPAVLVSLLLSPLLGYLYILALPPLPIQKKQDPAHAAKYAEILVTKNKQGSTPH